MEINIIKDGDIVTVALVGRLDSNSSPELEAKLKEVTPTAKELYFEFKDLSYLSSAGLRILLSTQKVMSKQGKMVLRHVNDLIMETLDMTGFSNFLTIED